MSVWMYKIFVHSVSIDQANFDAPRDGQVGKRILCKSITEQTVDCNILMGRRKERTCTKVLQSKGSETNHKIGVQIILAPWHVLF